jgi:hypothetical protein
MTMPLARRIGFGLALPIVAFIAWQLGLVASTSGSGSWDGMTVFFASLVLVPALLVAGCWVLPWAWSSLVRLVLAGLSLPGIVAMLEYAWLHRGGYRLGRLIDTALHSGHPALGLFVVALYAPLVVAIVHAVRSRARSG